MTKQEAAFSGFYAETGDARYAAQMAGYAHPHQRAAGNLAKPEVMATIRELQTARLHNDLLPLAINTLQTAMTDDKVPWSQKIMAAKITIDRVYAAGDEAGRKDPATMTADEIAATLDRLKRELSDRAKPIVEVSPNPAETGAFD